MRPINIEIKAKSDDHHYIRKVLVENNADFRGIDHQIDMYFNVPFGRLKLREGSIENNLIFYDRENVEGPKQSTIILYKSEPNTTLKDILIQSNGILAVVDKQREIYFIENVKFHIDTVKDLGTFVEIEAIDRNQTIGKDTLLAQCQHYMKLFKIDKKDLLSKSYSDMIIAVNSTKKHN